MTEAEWLAWIESSRVTETELQAMLPTEADLSRMLFTPEEAEALFSGKSE